ncbi:MAG: ArnT family glycosyltransferase [Elusimicrobiota bacterium]
MERSNRRRTGLGLFVLALVVRLALLPWARSIGLAGDEEYYWRTVAQNVAQGQLFTMDHQLRPPLWGYLLALPAFFSADPFFGRAFDCLVGALTAPFVFLTAEAVFDRRTAVAAGLIYALYPEHVFFSQYLFAEPCFSLLTVIAAWLYFKGLRNGEPRAVDRAFIVGGIALLAKEFALISFASMLLLLPREGSRARIRSWTKKSVYFFLPMTVYCLVSWHRTGEFVLLSKAPIANLRKSIGLSWDADAGVGSLEEFFVRYSRMSPAAHAANSALQTERLWSPNSYPAVRLLGGGPKEFTQDWEHRIPHAGLLAILVGAAHVILVILGLSGMIYGPEGRFKEFAVANLAMLTLCGTLAMMVSRFRVPFLYLLVISAAYAIVHRGRIRAKMGDRKASLLFLASVALFVAVTIHRWTRFGRWG